VNRSRDIAIPPPGRVKAEPAALRGLDAGGKLALAVPSFTNGAL